MLFSIWLKNKKQHEGRITRPPCLTINLTNYEQNAIIYLWVASPITSNAPGATSPSTHRRRGIASSLRLGVSRCGRARRGKDRC